MPASATALRFIAIATFSLGVVWAFASARSDTVGFLVTIAVGLAAAALLFGLARIVEDVSAIRAGFEEDEEDEPAGAP